MKPIEEPKIESNVIQELDINLSQHFTLRELVTTSHREIDNRPSPEIVERLKILALDFLEPIRLKFGPIRINSGYRCPTLNTAIGGAKESAHKYGCAADLIPLDKRFTTTDVVRWIVDESGLDYDQVIDEGSSTAFWVHIGLRRPGFEKKARQQALIFRNGTYTNWVG